MFTDKDIKKRIMITKFYTNANTCLCIFHVRNIFGRQVNKN